MLTSNDLLKIKGLLEGSIVPIRTELAIIKKDVVDTNKQVRKFGRNLKTAVNFLDRWQIKLQSRIERVETHLGFGHGL